MSLEDEVTMLRNIPLFANIDSSKLKLLAFTSDRLTFEADQTLFEQGSAGDAAYIIIDGEADVLIDTGGKSALVATLGRNDIIGEIAILCDVPRTATVRAKGKLVALRIAKDVFFRLILDFPQIGVEVMRELAHRLDQTTHQLREVIAGQKN